jgi:hypothetical protein
MSASVDCKVCTWQKAMLDSLLLSLTVLPTVLPVTAGKRRLFKNDFTPTPNSAIADFTEADFTGYASDALAIGTPANLNDNVDCCVTAGAFTATAGSPFVPNTIYGVYMTDGTPTLWYAAARFPVPVPIAAAGDFLNVRFFWSLMLQLDTLISLEE